MKITQFLTKLLTFLCDSDDDGLRQKMDLCLVGELWGQRPGEDAKCSDICWFEWCELQGHNIQVTLLQAQAEVTGSVALD